MKLINLLCCGFFSCILVLSARTTTAQEQVKLPDTYAEVVLSVEGMI